MLTNYLKIPRRGEFTIKLDKWIHNHKTDSIKEVVLDSQEGALDSQEEDLGFLEDSKWIWKTSWDFRGTLEADFIKGILEVDFSKVDKEGKEGKKEQGGQTKEGSKDIHLAMGVKGTIFNFDIER